MEENNVRDALKTLLEYNDKQLNPEPIVGEFDGLNRPATVNDIQDFNEELLINIADLLGMSDVYLDYEA